GAEGGRARAGVGEKRGGMAAVPFKEDEVEKAKVRSHRAHELLQSSSTAMAQALSSASALGDWRLLFVQRDRLEAVSADDVNRVARTYFQKAHRTVGLYVPPDPPPPPAPPP